MPNRLRRARGSAAAGRRGRPWLRATRLALAAGCLGGGVLVLGAAGTAGAAPPAITLYSGQHVQTTQALVSAFEKKTGIKVNVRFDDEDVLASQIVEEGGHSPADVFFTENSPPLQYLASKNLLAPLAKSTLAETPAKYDSPNGKWVGVSARVSVIVYNTTLLKPSQLPTSAMQLSQAEVEGQDRPGRRRDRLPAHRHLGRPHLREGRGAQVAQRRQGQRRRPPPPGQRDGDRRGQPRPGRPRRHQPVLLVPAAGGGRRIEHALGDRLLRPPRRRLRDERVRRRDLAVVAAPAPKPSSWSSSWPRPRVRASSPTATASSTRSGRR